MIICVIHQQTTHQSCAELCPLSYIGIRPYAQLLIHWNIKQLNWNYVSFKLRSRNTGYPLMNYPYIVLY